jgi:hypothetical protein
MSLSTIFRGRETGIFYKNHQVLSKSHAHTGIKLIITLMLMGTDGLCKCNSSYFLYLSISQKFDSENMFSRRGSNL